MNTLNFIELVYPIILLFLLIFVSLDAFNSRTSQLQRSLISNQSNRFMRSLYKYFNVETFLDSLTSHLVNDDRERLANEFKLSFISFVFVVFLGLTLNIKPFYLFALIFLFFPLIKRITYKRDMKKQFKNDFFDAIFYLILFVQGGMTIQISLNEISRLFKDSSPFKRSLLRIIKEYNLTNDNFVGLFSSFEKEYDIQEVSYFVNSLRISHQNGVEISDSLINQLDYIRTNRNYYFKSLAGSMGNSLTPLMVVFSMIPILIIMATPPIIEVMASLMQQ